MVTTRDNVVATLKTQLQAATRPSAWRRGVYVYALELVEECEAPTMPTDANELTNLLLSGATSWSAYSWGGCSLIYDSDIAERLCTPSELKKTRNGERRPNANEVWLDVQARALYQAAILIRRAVKITAAAEDNS